MTVATETSSQSHTVVGVGPYNFAFPVYDAAHLRVFLVKTNGLRGVEVDPSNYSVSVATDFSEAEVTLGADFAAANAGIQIRLYRLVPFKQPLALATTNFLSEKAVERELDLEVMRDQQLNERLIEAEQRVEEVTPVEAAIEAAAAAAASAASAAAAAATISATISGYLNVQAYGAVGDGAADDTAAFIAAIADAALLGKSLLVPETNAFYKITDTLTISNSKFSIFGAGRPVIKMANATKDIFAIATGMSEILIRDFKLQRTMGPTTGRAIVSLGSVDRVNIEDIHADGHLAGLVLSTTAYSAVRRCVIENCTSHGLWLLGGANDSQLQWYLDDILCQNNAGSGFVAIGTNGGSATFWSLGDFNGLRTFNNAAYGLFVQGFPLKPIYGLRGRHCFFGADGLNEVFLDTYGDVHELSNSFVEINLAGHAIVVTANNSLVSLESVIVQGARKNGFDISAPGTILTGCHAIGCGAGGATIVEKKGVRLAADDCQVIGGNFSNRSGDTTQAFGVSVEAANCGVQGILAKNNANDAILLAGAANDTNTMLKGNTVSAGLSNLTRGQILQAASAAAIAAAATVYLGSGRADASIASAIDIVSRPGTVRKIIANVNAAPGIGQSFTYTLQKNAVDTAMTGQITGAGSQVVITANPIAFAQGDLIAVKLVTSAGAAVVSHRVAVCLD